MTASVSEVAQAIVDLFTPDLPKGKKLDYSEASLKTLDQLVSSLWGADGPSEENYEAMIWAFGCYVGEVLQRHYNGVWNEGDDGLFFDGINSGAGVSPWSWIAKRFEFGADEAVAKKYTLAKKLLIQDRK
jgi:hypothetical protein